MENNLIAETSDKGLEPGMAVVRHNTLIGIEGHAVYLAQIRDIIDNEIAAP